MSQISSKTTESAIIEQHQRLAVQVRLLELETEKLQCEKVTLEERVKDLRSQNERLLSEQKETRQKNERLSDEIRTLYKEIIEKNNAEKKLVEKARVEKEALEQSIANMEVELKSHQIIDKEKFELKRLNVPAAKYFVRSDCSLYVDACFGDERETCVLKKEHGPTLRNLFELVKHPENSGVFFFRAPFFDGKYMTLLQNTWLSCHRTVSHIKFLGKEAEFELFSLPEWKSKNCIKLEADGLHNFRAIIRSAANKQFICIHKPQTQETAPLELSTTEQDPARATIFKFENIGKHMDWLKSRLPPRNYYICAYGEVTKEEGSRKIKVMQKGYLREMDYWRKSPGNYLYLDGEKDWIQRGFSIVASEFRLDYNEGDDEGTVSIYSHKRGSYIRWKGADIRNLSIADCVGTFPEGTIAKFEVYKIESGVVKLRIVNRNWRFLEKEHWHSSLSTHSQENNAVDLLFESGLY